MKFFGDAPLALHLHSFLWWIAAVLVTRALFEGGCNLGEASMIRLGANFTIMLMVSYSGDAGSSM